MSVDVSRPAVRVAARAHALRVPLIALLSSRLLVFLAGAAGERWLHPHAPVAFVDAARRLGRVGDLLTGSADRFDAGYYLTIAQSGYQHAGAPQLAFFPLYPLCIRLLGAITGSLEAAGMLISALAFVAAVILVHRLSELELGRRAADATAVLLCFAPLSFYFTAIYTESLFLALTAGALLAQRRGRWRLACALGALAAITRLQGVLLVVVLLVARLREERRIDRELAWLAAIPAALCGWLALLAAGGYGWTAPFAVEQIHWGHETVGPAEGLLSALIAMARGIGYLARGGALYHPTRFGPFPTSAENAILGVGLLVSLAALEACRRLLRPEYTVYAGLALLLLLSSPLRGTPLSSSDRYVLTIFPLWMAGGALVARRRLRIPVILLGGLALAFYTAQFASWAFIA